MQATFLAVRAIGTALGSKLWLSSLIVVIITGTLLIGLLLWLVSISGWWWLLAIPVSIIISVAAVVMIVFRLLISYARPKQTDTQKEFVDQFINKVEFIQEFAGTPKFIILFRTVRSIAAPKSDTYLQDIFQTKNLKDDFLKVVDSFK